MTYNPQPTGREGPTTISSAVVTLTKPTAKTTSCVILVETAPIRYTMDGTAPTTTVGQLVNVGDRIYLHSPAEIAGFKCIRATGSDGAINVEYWQEVAAR